MSLPKFSVLGSVTILSLVTLSTGCKSSRPSTPPATPSEATTNQAISSATRPALPPDSSNNMAPDILAWDAVEKEYQAKHGELSAPFTFNLTNVSPAAVVIYDTSTSCDCTVAKLPSKPWIIPQGGAGEIHASIDLHNKSGTVTNQIIVFTSQGNRSLRVKALVPGPY